jgi:uncharacterized membrane protein YoaK (UPF0700 family)
MVTKLPRWVEVGGFSLTLIAGSVNAIGLLGFEHQAVSHLTGTSTLLGVRLTEGNWESVLHLVLVIASFVLGAAISGLIVQDATLKLGRRYGVVLLLESGLLFAAMWTLTNGLIVGHLLASAACGLQNAMVTTYSGASMRTTHVSGLFTDIGIALGHLLRGIPANTRRLQLQLVLIAGFILGGSLGAVTYRRYNYTALSVPAALALLLALIYWTYWFKVKRTERREAIARVS